ncbi:RTA1-domain-containing protein [Glonium stellatum]|uniref:RTA1-domain-containing protein n=1 Tax=Glonium stellatum TaxID=574774 RepID=A0A8E2EYQ0_9PEZI|nr:RTA1-domain-containing protein [Glonium stellatum]
MSTTTSGIAINTSIPNSDCTLSTCSIEQAQLLYDPTLTGNALFLGIFSLCLALQLIAGIYYRTWGYLVGMFCGLILEMVGYVGRVQMHFNPFLSNPFMMYLICITIAPVFITASIYLCLARIIVVYGEHLSRFRPRFYTITFIICDFVSLVLQAGGGAIVEIATNYSFEHVGIDIVMAGLGFQVASLVLFLGLCAGFWMACIKRQDELDIRFRPLRSSLRFIICLYALFAATIAILIRSIFRIAELSKGFHGNIWNNEVDYMVLEGGMMAFACLALTFAHPGVAFRRDWHDADFKLKRPGNARR